MVTVEELSLMSDEDKGKFWGGLSADTMGRLIKWSTTVKVPIDELRDRFIAKMATLTQQLAAQNLSAAQLEVVARRQFANEIRPGKSQAETYEGVVLGWGPLKDWNDFWYKIAKGAFNKDPLQAKLDGLCDDNGTALVTIEIKEKKGQYFKQNVGEVLAHEYERGVMCIGRAVQREKGEDTMRIFSIKMTGEPARFLDPKRFPQPKIGLVCRWRCNVQEVDTENNFIRANGATVTAFESAIVETSSGPVGGLNKDLTPKLYDMKRAAGLLDQSREEFHSPIIGLTEWIGNFAKKAGYYAVIKGEIINMYERSLRIGNADQLDIEDIPSIIVNLDSAIPDQMFYGKDSTVIMAIQPYLRTKKQKDDSGKYVEVLDDLGNPTKEVVANGLAIFPVIAMPKIEVVVPAVTAAAPVAEEPAAGTAAPTPKQPIEL